MKMLYVLTATTTGYPEKKRLIRAFDNEADAIAIMDIIYECDPRRAVAVETVEYKPLARTVVHPAPPVDYIYTPMPTAPKWTPHYNVSCTVGRIEGVE